MEKWKVTLKMLPHIVKKKVVKILFS